MSRTIRKDRHDVKYKEGQTCDRYVYKCTCNRCTGKNSNVAKAHKKQMQVEIMEYNSGVE